MSYTKVQLVNLSNTEEAKKRNKPGSNSYYTKEYQGMDPVARARKAALAVSDNGRCWWVYNKIYGDMIHRTGYERHNKRRRF